MSDYLGIFDNGYSTGVDAIRVYMSSTPVKTPEAQTIKDAFIRWYDDLTVFGKGTQSNFDLARNQRNRFELANATSPDETAAVKEVQTTGLSHEQASGEPDRRDESGMLPGPVAPPPPPLIPTPWLIGGAIVGGLALIAAAYGKGRG